MFTCPINIGTPLRRSSTSFPPIPILFCHMNPNSSVTAAHSRSPPTLFSPFCSPLRSPRSLQIGTRRRLKIFLCCSASAAIPISTSVGELLHGLVSAFPSVNSLELLVPALGFVSGTALYLASARRSRRRGVSAGEWVLFSSPTPFNRSVFLRCSSLRFKDGGELLDTVSERLATRERHSVEGRMIPTYEEREGGVVQAVKYQRACVRTDDGGVVSLDWPENLDLEKERGLEATVVIVPGSTEGSMDGQAIAFVQLALRCGFFPIVMNPRGCAGSPLTSSRLFTAADSDDVCLAIQFIKAARPWTTLVGVGCQYGANMLTKYLGESGKQTPLTAAVCLNNPFDLEEATKAYTHSVAIGQRLIGLQEILKYNKKIFLGKGKGFNVSEALSATSVRDFDRAVSMISYGFDSIEEFYTWSSTTHSVGNIKIPVLFIQVLRAIGDGESLMNALEGAVPEVRQKLMNAICEIMQTHGRNINFGKFIKHGWKKSTVQEKIKEIPTLGTGDIQNKEYNVDNARKLDGSSHIHSGISPSGTTDRHDSKSSYSDTKITDFSREPKGLPQDAAVFQGTSGQEYLNTNEQADKKQDVKKIEGEGTANVPVSGGKGNSDTDETLPSALVSTEESLANSSYVLENKTKGEQNDAQETIDHNDQNKVVQRDNSSFITAGKLSYISSATSSIDVSEALAAFKTFDDSTQKAVNSLFGVIENLIDQLEKKKSGAEKEQSETEDFKATSEESQEKTDGSKKRGEDSCQSDSKLDSTIDACQSYAKESKETKSRNDDGRQKFDHPMSSKDDIYMASNNIERLDGLIRYLLQLTTDAFLASVYKSYLREYFLKHMSNMKSYNSCPTTDLFLDHEKGHWKILDNIGNNKYSLEKVKEHTAGQTEHPYSSLQDIRSEKIIDTTFVIINNEKSEIDERSIKDSGVMSVGDEQSNFITVRVEKLMWFIKTTILGVLEAEVRRKLGIYDTDTIEQNLASDMETVANAIAFGFLHDRDFVFSFKENGSSRAKNGTISGQLIVSIVSSAIQHADHLKKVLPAGVIVGSILACLARYFDISPAGDKKQNADVQHIENGNIKWDGVSSILTPDSPKDCDIKNRVENDLDAVDSCNGDVMVGAVPSILVASSSFAHHQTYEPNCQEPRGTMHTHRIKDGSDSTKEFNVGMGQGNDKSDVVESLNDRAVSAVEQTISTKIQSKVDQERLLSILSELGQKGGLLRYLGNIALLWGGIRGAVSLSDRLIRILRMAERPLIHRLMGFVSMTMVLWFPIIIPLLPHIIQSWKAKRSMGVSGYTCLFGLHGAILILVILWGKRIRGYELPLERYGLNLTSASQVHAFVNGLVGGILLVMGIHSINVLLGHACFTCPSNLSPKSAGTALLLKAYGCLFFLTLRRIIIATSVALVEELVFRSWLPDEVATDLGFHWAIVISGFAFAVIQRSVSSIPALLLLSVALFGAKQRHHGSLSVPIGVHTGIMITSFFLQTVNFVYYKPNSPFSLATSHLQYPFGGATGLVVTLVLATLLYPRKYVEEKKT